MALSGGELIYVVLRGEEGEACPVCGWVVELADDEVIVGTAVTPATARIPGSVEGASGSEKLRFIKIPRASVTTSQPQTWKGNHPHELPSWVSSRACWRAAGAKDLESSEADAQPAAAGKKSSKKGLSQELRDLSHLFGDGDDSESDEDDEIGQATQAAASSSRVLPPGAPSKGRGLEEPKKKKKQEIDVQALLADGLAKGQSASEMLPLALLAMVVKKGKESKAKSSSHHGGFSSDSESDEADFSKSGMKAVVSLNKLHARIKNRPAKIYQEFEREIVEDMGIVAGQAWTIRDYLKKQAWGKFKGIFRCAVMDAAAYEMLRAGETESATAQLAQNMKAKLQAVMSGGDWEAGWLLTGLADPLSRREFAGSKQEMAVVSGYLEALSKLKKKVREAGQGNHGDEEDDEGGTSHRK